MLTVVNVGGSPKESGNVLLEHGERCVEVLQDADHGVLAFHRVLGSFQGAHCVEGSI